MDLYPLYVLVAIYDIALLMWPDDLEGCDEDGPCYNQPERSERLLG